MSNLKKDIEGVLNQQFDAILVKTDIQGRRFWEADKKQVKQATTQIINLIESVIPKEDEHTWRAYGQPDGTVVCDHCNVADDVNNLLLSQVADIKSKLRGGE